MDKLPEGTQATIYTIAGEKVCELLTAKEGKITWNCANDSGHPVASGVYLCVMQSPSGARHTQKIAILR